MNKPSWPIPDAGASRYVNGKHPGTEVLAPGCNPSDRRNRPSEWRHFDRVQRAGRIALGLGAMLSCSTVTGPSAPMARYAGAYDLESVSGQVLPVIDTAYTRVAPRDPSRPADTLIVLRSVQVTVFPRDSVLFSVTRALLRSDGAQSVSNALYTVAAHASGDVLILDYTIDMAVPADTASLYIDPVTKQTVLNDPARSRTSPIQLGTLRFIRKSQPSSY